jgi:hypothetical protein
VTILSFGRVDVIFKCAEVEWGGADAIIVIKQHNLQHFHFELLVRIMLYVTCWLMSLLFFEVLMNIILNVSRRVLIVVCFKISYNYS